MLLQKILIITNVNSFELGALYPIMESLHFLVYLKLYQHLETTLDLFTGVYEC
jgi:hypothetical protein